MTPDTTQGRAIPFVVGKAMFQLLFRARLVWILPCTQSYVIGLSIVEEVNASAFVSLKIYHLYLKKKTKKGLDKGLMHCSLVYQNHPACSQIMLLLLLLMSPKLVASNNTSKCFGVVCQGFFWH